MYSLIVFLTLICLLLDPIFAIGVDPENITKIYFFGIPASDFALALMLITFFINLKAITTFVSNKILLLVGISFFFFLIQGILINWTSNFSIFNIDIRTFLWFFGGIAFAFMLVKTERILGHLKIIIVISIFLIILSSVKSEGYYAFTKGLNVERIGHPNIYILSGWLFSPIILLFNITPPKLLKKIVPLSSTILFLYFVAILSATRSSLIISFILILFFAISLRIRINNSTILIDRYTTSTKFYVLIPSIVTIIYLAFYLDASRLLRFLTIFDFHALLNDNRFFELKSFFIQSDLMQIIFGRGLGGTISSSIHQGELTSTLHIGVLNFWMKMGILPFLTIFWYLYIKIPIRYIRSFNICKYEDTDYYHTANVVLLPSLFPWIISLLLSGGFSEINFLFAGFILYFYGIVKTQGIDSILQ